MATSQPLFLAQATADYFPVCAHRLGAQAMGGRPAWQAPCFCCGPPT